MASMDFSLSSLFYIQKTMFFLSCLQEQNIHQQKSQIHQNIRSIKDTVLYLFTCVALEIGWYTGSTHSMNKYTLVLPLTLFRDLPFVLLGLICPFYLWKKKIYICFTGRFIFIDKWSGKTKLFTEWLHGVCSVTMVYVVYSFCGSSGKIWLH